MVNTSSQAEMAIDPAGQYYYVSESIWTKGNRGTRQDLVSVYDSQNPKLQAEVPIPGPPDRRRAQAQFHRQPRREARLHLQHAAVLIGQRGGPDEAQIPQHDRAARLRHIVPDAGERLLRALRRRLAGDRVAGRQDAPDHAQRHLLLRRERPGVRQQRGRPRDRRADAAQLYGPRLSGEAGRQPADRRALVDPAGGRRQARRHRAARRQLVSRRHPAPWRCTGRADTCSR